MDSKIFQEVPENEREAYILANSDSTEEMPVKKSYEESEMMEMRRQHVANSLEMKRLTDEYEKIKAEYNGKMKPLAEDNKYTLRLLQTGFVEVKQQVYLLADHTLGMMGYYDAKGELIESRRLLPHERQLRVK